MINELVKSALEHDDDDDDDDGDDDDDNDDDDDGGGDDDDDVFVGMRHVLAVTPREGGSGFPRLTTPRLRD